MLKHSDAILKLALALAVLLAGGGVGFYYGIFLPSQDIRRQSQELAEKQAAKQAESKALAERAQREQAAQVEYQDCVNFAELSYKERWTQTCQGLHDADQAALQDCSDDLFSTEAGCRAKHPVRPARDCGLPGAMAQELTEARDKRKAECAVRLQSRQTGGEPVLAPSSEPLAQ